jgi:DNA-binding winged helix-turn-helix (wHTH) protein
MLKNYNVGQEKIYEQEHTTEIYLASNNNYTDFCEMQCVKCPKQREPIYLDTGVFIKRYLLSISGVRHKISNPMFRVLCAFNENEGRVVSRQFLLAYAWGVDNKVANNVTVAISELRVLLRNKCNLEIITIHGKGYQMVNTSEEFFE